MKQFLTLAKGQTYVDDSDPRELTALYRWSLNNTIKDPPCGHTFAGCLGYIENGSWLTRSNGERFYLRAGMYFASGEPMHLCGGSGILLHCHTYRPMFVIGGPIEDKGRLRYIDGCTDSLLLPPIKCGDPCLNALYFPAGVNQTQHTHPSLRAGLVVQGQGECILPDREPVPLVPGVCFVIEKDGLHSFRTPPESSMTVIAYHPDSDTGPKDDDHPMVNRTIVEGVSARHIDKIRTK
jgi:hypothetical protein